MTYLNKRAPEVLLGAEQYTCAIDIWSVGCIFAELICGKPLFPGEGELNQLDKIFTLLSDPTPEIWPGLTKTKHYNSLKFNKTKKPKLKERMSEALSSLSDLGMSLLEGMLTYDPERRLTAKEILQHPFFEEEPLACSASQLPSY